MENKKVEKSQNKPSLFSSFIKVVISIGCMLALFFLPAGRWDWWEAWVLIGSFLVYTIALFLWLRWHDPLLLTERNKPGSNVKAWDRMIMIGYTFLLLVMFVVASLDSGRYHWSTIFPAIRIVGWIGIVLAMALIWWVMAINTFLSSMVRIQNERGQQVITSGPYQYVRHPMYVGVMMSFLCIPLILGSWWAMIPAVLIEGVFIIRTALEDRMLRQELAGYQQYADRVRFRIMPGVW
ncbi:MAG: isoprenylcysteine carboxylmethyltransferase family protein [Anaerolineales bacterium]|nr:isoprenylcysteine carboxylmethyltransferase family protein [Anaerolineales bacterium]